VEFCPKEKVDGVGLLGSGTEGVFWGCEKLNELD